MRLSRPPPPHLVKFGNKAKTWSPAFPGEGEGSEREGGPPAPIVLRVPDGAAPAAHLTWD